MNKIDKDYCFKDNDDFIPVKLSGLMAVIRRKDDSPEVRECIKNPDRFLNNAEILKDSRTTKAGIVKFADGKEVFIKCFNNKGLAYSLKYIFREARPFRVWTATWALEKAGIPTPRPIAAVAKYTAGFPGKAYLIRNVVPDIVPTLDFFAKLNENNKLRELYFKSVAAVFAKMHNAGIYHGDAKCSNIYVEDCGKDRHAYGVWDLLSCQIGEKPVSKALRDKEISRIAQSFTEITKRCGSDADEAEIKKQLQEKYA